MNAAEAAAYLGIPPRSLYELAAAGRIPCYRLSQRRLRFDLSDLEGFKQSCRCMPKKDAGDSRSTVLLAVGATAVSHRLGWLRDHNRAVSAVTGAMLVVVGFLMITNTFARLSGLFAPLGS